MKKVVEEAEPDRVVQIVTNNEATMKVAGKKLMEIFPNLYCIASGAHFLDLIVEDLSKKTRINDELEKSTQSPNLL